MITLSILLILSILSVDALQPDPSHLNVDTTSETRRTGLYEVWKCKDPHLVKKSIDIMERFKDDAGLINQQMSAFLRTYRSGGWTSTTIQYARSRAFIADKSPLDASTIDDNPNFCYIARLDESMLLFLVRVYQEQ